MARGVEHVNPTHAPMQVLGLHAIAVGPRMRRNTESIDELAASLLEHGLLQPIVVRQLADGRYGLVAGGRRLEAARTLGWSTIPARILSSDEADGRVLELVENLQRQDLTPQDEADAFEELLNQRRWTHAELAEAIKRSPSYISKRLRVFRDPHLRSVVIERRLAVTTAEEVLAAPEEYRPALLQRALAENWDATAARAAVRELWRPLANGKTRGFERRGFPERGRRQGRDSSTEPVAVERARVPERQADTASSRPAGLSRRIRDLRLTLRPVHAWDLTETDRRELRGLYRELGLLARASTQKRPPVIPPLPASAQPKRPAVRRAATLR